MNKTQKGAWAVLVIALSLSAFVITIPLLWLDEMPIMRIVPRTLIILSLAAMGSSLIFLRRKQSPAEVDYDERDVVIKRKALLVSHTATWVLIFLGCALPVAITNWRGTFSVDALPIALFALSMADMIVYSLTILIQYGWKGEKP
jgi:hypothetical protein